MSKIEQGKNAMKQLNDAQRLIASAYNQLIADGVAERHAKTICRVFFKEAISGTMETENQRPEDLINKKDNTQKA